MASQKKNEYDNQYVRDNYHRISLNIKKEEYESLKNAAEKENESVNCYIKQAIDKSLNSINKWRPIRLRPMTEEEQEQYPDWIYYDKLIIDSPLPDDNEDVILSLKDGSVRVDTFCKDDSGCYFDSIDIDDVIAWMPLPEPYKIVKKESE